PGIDGRADLYGLGCVAYYLLTGQPVFSADSDVATALAHVKDEPVRPSLRSEFQISPALEAVILESLAKEPGSRPASADVFSERLAVAIPEDAWTPRKAHAWWELHRMKLAPPAPDTAAVDGGSEQSAKVKHRRRCWPRLDRKPLTNVSVAGQ